MHQESLQLKIPTEKIGTVIGPGGKVIQKMQKDFCVDINIEDDGTVSIAATRCSSGQSS